MSATPKAERREQGRYSYTQLGRKIAKKYYDFGHSDVEKWACRKFCSGNCFSRLSWDRMSRIHSAYRRKNR